MKRAVLFLNGELADLSQVRKQIKKSDLMVGVDGGTRHIFKLKLRPDLIIGDFDSLKRKTGSIPVIKFPKDKDFTDTELAIAQVMKQGYQEIVLIGWLGRRLDHMISNLMTIANLPVKISIVEGRQQMFLVKDKITVRGKPGDLVSLIPLLGDCLGVKTQGLKWRLQGQSLKSGRGRGLSNVMLGRQATIKLKKGCLLVIATGRDPEGW